MRLSVAAGSDYVPLSSWYLRPVSVSEINATSDWRRPQSAVLNFRNSCDG
ncbi:hypothetical protein KPSA1_07395 [Pseudomonas syringae pv. actinidiae]|uniref:Uncharacterized protein n=1 Tax=Pseudomonas syringae pv. actinidiae TaxID=103796 RepID=A0A2V0QLT2_PSESF|nr:hypothetical protein KPSA1_07395 [Pseudomonas syringae pv. actinidiae]